MKYNHQFLISFEGDSLTTNRGVHVNSNDKICSRSQLINRAYEIFPEKKDKPFLVKSHVLLLNK